MDAFVPQQNVQRFLHHLDGEQDVGRRVTLLNLLIEEENKLGAQLAQLAHTERLIADITVMIDRQWVLLEAFNDDNARSLAIALLDRLLETQALYHEHLRKLQAEARAEFL